MNIVSKRIKPAKREMISIQIENVLIRIFFLEKIKSMMNIAKYGDIAQSIIPNREK
ncbi:MAG: hypothetical protein JRI92_01405 [Deltaproteobacteria bacterium]|nr:hypothetical protein [Deltaproteobacteria bacterium]